MKTTALRDARHSSRSDVSDVCPEQLTGEDELTFEAKDGAMWLLMCQHWYSFRIRRRPCWRLRSVRRSELLEARCPVPERTPYSAKRHLERHPMIPVLATQSASLLYSKKSRTVWQRFPHVAIGTTRCPCQTSARLSTHHRTRNPPTRSTIHDKMISLGPSDPAFHGCSLTARHSLACGTTLLQARG